MPKCVFLFEPNDEMKYYYSLLHDNELGEKPKRQYRACNMHSLFKKKTEEEIKPKTK